MSGDVGHIFRIADLEVRGMKNEGIVLFKIVLVYPIARVHRAFYLLLPIIREGGQMVLYCAH